MRIFAGSVYLQSERSGKRSHHAYRTLKQAGASPEGKSRKAVYALPNTTVQVGGHMGELISPKGPIQISAVYPKN